MMRDIRWNQVVLAFLVGSVLTAGALHFKRGSWMKFDPQDKYERMLDRFSRDLDLTPEQRTKVAEIFETKRQRIGAIREESAPRIDEVRRNTSDEIRRLLNPEQQVRFDEMEKKQAESKRRRRERREASPPPPPPPPGR